MNKLKEMYNNGMAKLCGLHAAAYLALAGTANASSGNSDAGSYIDTITETAKDVIGFVQSDNFSLESGVTAASSLFLFSAGAGIAIGIAETIDNGFLYAPSNFAQGVATGAMMGGAYAASIAINTTAYGWKGGVATAVGEAIVLGVGVCYGEIRSRC